MSSNSSVYVYVAVSMIAIIILSVCLIMNCNKEEYYGPNESYGDSGVDLFLPLHEETRDTCLCSGRKKLCSNREKMAESYLKGNTEFQDFAVNQQLNGGPHWKTH